MRAQARKNLYDDVKGGAFVQEWSREQAAGGARLQELTQRALTAPDEPGRGQCDRRYAGGARDTGGRQAVTRLAGKAAIVTGAAQGIGLGIAQALAAAGASVTLADIADEEGARAAAELRAAGAAVEYQHADVTVEEDVRSLVEAAAARWGRLDIVVNNAGIVAVQTVEQSSTGGLGPGDGGQRALDLSHDQVCAAAPAAGPVAAASSTLPRFPAL